MPSPPPELPLPREAHVCLLANRLGRRGGPRRFFAVISRLGDGMFWYVLMGALIAAGLDGIAGRAELPEPIESSPGLLDPNTRQNLGIEQLPGSLQVACDVLERDDVLGAALGARLLDTFLAVKRQEVKTFEGVTTAVEQLRHFWKF